MRAACRRAASANSSKKFCMRGGARMIAERLSFPDFRERHAQRRAVQQDVELRHAPGDECDAAVRQRFLALGRLDAEDDRPSGEHRALERQRRPRRVVGDPDRHVAGDGALVHEEVERNRPPVVRLPGPVSGDRAEHGVGEQRCTRTAFRQGRQTVVNEGNDRGRRRVRGERQHQDWGETGHLADHGVPAVLARSVPGESRPPAMNLAH